MTDRQTRKVKIRVAKAERSRTNIIITMTNYYYCCWAASPDISRRKFLEIYSLFFQKLLERFYRKFPTATNRPNNCVFAYNGTFQRRLQHM